MLSTRSRSIFLYSSGLMFLIGLLIASRKREEEPEAVRPAVAQPSRGLGDDRDEVVPRSESRERHRGDERNSSPDSVAIATDPNDLAAILSEVEAEARKSPRAAAERATAALCGLELADSGGGNIGQGEEAVYLSAAHMRAVVGLAREVFAGDRALGGGFSERLPDALRDAAIAAIVREDVDSGEMEDVIEWIEGMPDQDAADIAKWELARRLFQEHGSSEGLEKYPPELIRDVHERRAVAHRFSVIAGQNPITR